MPTADERPVPDPTALTTHHLEREIKAVKDLLDDKVEARHAEQTAQTKGYEAQLQALEKVMDVRFQAVAEKFETVERQRVEQKQDTKAAVEAALIAQKEATDKTEVSVGKQYESVSKEVSALTGRVIGLEKLRQGGTDMRVAIFAVISVGLVVLTVLGSNGLIGR